MKLVEPRTRPWTRREYYEAAEIGWFEKQRVQLVAGEVMIIRPPHYWSLRSLTPH